VIHLTERFKTGKLIVVLIVCFLMTGLLSVGGLLAQIKKEDVDFEVLATVTMKKGDVLWNLAQEYYKDPMKWKYIAEMNKIKNERRIPVGTVIYVPVEDAKKIVKEAEKVVEAKKVVASEMELKLAELQKELDRIKKDYEECLVRSKELAAALKEKDDMIAGLEAKVKELNSALAAQTELEGQLEDMRVAAKSTSQRKEELDEALKDRDARVAEKEARIAEMEWKLKQSQEEVSKLERAKAELNEKIAKAEEGMQPGKVQHVSDPRSRVAAIAIALVGSIIWMASK